MKENRRKRKRTTKSSDDDKERTSVEIKRQKKQLVSLIPTAISHQQTLKGFLAHPLRYLQLAPVVAPSSRVACTPSNNLSSSLPISR